MVFRRYEFLDIRYEGELTDIPTWAKAEKMEVSVSQQILWTASDKVLKKVTKLFRK